MKVTIKERVVTEKEVDVNVGLHIYLVILRYTTKSGSQYVGSLSTFNYKGNPPYIEGAEVEVVAVYEYRLTERETVPNYEVYGENYLVRID